MSRWTGLSASNRMAVCCVSSLTLPINSIKFFLLDLSIRSKYCNVVRNVPITDNCGNTLLSVDFLLLDRSDFLVFP
jgi:hypothetical protein